MRSHVATFSLIAVALVTVACNKPESQLIGKWQMDTSSAPKSGNAQQQADTKKLAGMMTLEFKGDKTFSGTILGLAMEGTYEMSDRTVTMKTTKMMGQDVSKMPGSNQTETMTLSDDGKKLSTSGGKGGPVSFVKAAQ